MTDPTDHRSTTIISRGGRTMIDLVFRNAVPADIAAIHQLSQPYVAAGRLIHRDRMLFATQAAKFHVMEIDGAVVACAGLRGFDDIAEIFNVVVAERWQSYGIGRLLLSGMMSIAAALGYAHALIFSKGAADWFGRFGFRPVEVAALPAARIRMIVPERESVPMIRPVLTAADHVDLLARLTEVRVRFARSDVEVPWLGTVDALLPFAEEHDVEVDSLCWSGVCGTCRTRLRAGSVSYCLQPGVDPADREVLLCIARPVTNLVLEL